MFKPEGRLTVLGKTKAWYWHLLDVLIDEVVTHRKFDDCEAGPKTGTYVPNRKAGPHDPGLQLRHPGLRDGCGGPGPLGRQIIPLIKIETPMPLLYL